MGHLWLKWVGHLWLKQQGHLWCMGQLWQSELLLSGHMLTKLLVWSLLLSMSLFPTRRQVSGHNLMKQAMRLLANTSLLVAAKISLVLTKGLQKDPSQFYVMLFIVYPSKLCSCNVLHYIVKNIACSCEDIWQAKDSQDFLIIFFLHIASYDFIGFCILSFSYLCVALCKHTCCIAENTSILKVTAVTCVSIIGTVGQVVLNTSAS